MSKLSLSANWENLILATYPIDPEILAGGMPKGLEPDTIIRKAFVSLVAFDFNNTKIRWMKIRFHINFPK